MGNTGAWSKLLKQLSEIAHSRRGHDKIYFRQRWSMEVAMCLARRGAQAALRRANTFHSANSESLDDACSAARVRSSPSRRTREGVERRWALEMPRVLCYIPFFPCVFFLFTLSPASPPAM